MRYCKRNDVNFSVQLFEHTSQLPKEWNDHVPLSHFLHSEQLALTEQSHLPDISYLYAIISKENKTIALAYFQLLHIKPYHLDDSRLSSLQRAGWNVFSKTLNPKLLVAGHLFRHDICSFFCFNAPSYFETYLAYDAAIEAAMRKSCASAVLVKDMPKHLITYFQHYAPQYLLLRNDILMEMQINPEWQEMKDYEKSLKHKYAQRFRKVRKHWEELTIKELDVAETEKYKTQIFQLYQQVIQKQQVRLGYISEEYIPLLKKEFEQEFHIWMAYEHDRPVAFFSAWSKGDVFDMFYIGFDYASNEQLQLYFNILFFSVEQSIRFQKKKLILGRTALEAKARIGCKPVYLSTFLYIKNPVVRNIMLRLQQEVVNGEGEWENRHPFK